MGKRKRILYVQYTNPAAYPPLEHSSRILAGGGWHVQFLGTRADGADDLVFPAHARIGVRLRPFQPGGWRQKLHYFRFVGWCIAWCVAWRPTVIYCSDPLSAPVGVLAWYLLRVPVVYHEHDTPGPPTSAALGVVHAMRRRLARIAVACVVPQKERLSRFVAALKPRRAVCVWNCPAREEVVPPQDTIRSAEPTLWYHGSLNGQQLPLTVIDALALLPSCTRMRFAGYETLGHVGFVKQFLGRARELGIGERVEYVGTPSTRRGLYALAAKADVGLALFPRSFREPMAGASNKPFDYLACGLSLLLTESAEWSEFYHTAGCGRLTSPDSSEAIATTLRAMLDNPDQTRAMGAAGQRRVLDDWNYETQFEPVRRLLDSL